MRGLKILSILIFLSGTVLPAEETGKGRDILTSEALVNFDGTYIIMLENVLLLPIQEKMLLEYRFTDYIFRVDNDYNKAIIQPGLVYEFYPGIYIELVLGVGINGAGSANYEGFFETAMEKSRYILTGGMKFSYFIDNEFFFIIPNFSGTYIFNNIYGLKLKYYFSADSNRDFSHAVLIENKFRFNETLAADLGFTGTILTPEGKDTGFLYEIGARVELRLSDYLVLKFYSGYVDTRKDTRLTYAVPEARSRGIKGIFTVDYKMVSPSGRNGTE